MEEKNKKTFKELWADKRTKALIKLGLWFLFFAIFFIFIGIMSLFNNESSTNNNLEKETEKVQANIPGMLENLINSNYTFEYVVTDENNITYSYNGSKENEEIKGYYENNNGITKFIVKNNIVYKINGTEEIEDNTIVNDTDKKLFDLNNILSKIKNYEEVHEPVYENEQYSYSLDESLNIKISTKNNEIYSIEFLYNNLNYKLLYKNVFMP